jgi:GAF domain-containing protein
MCDEQRYVEILQQNASLANLYVASHSLHASLERPEVLAAIEQIIVNLVGSEEMGIFEVAGDRRTLRLVASMGIDASAMAQLPLGTGVIGRSTAAGSLWLAVDDPSAARAEHEGDLTACIPLAAGGSVVGAIAIFRLLPQKGGLGQTDRELFELLATHASSALLCSELLRASRATETRP